jgi:hypothetical protein
MTAVINVSQSSANRTRLAGWTCFGAGVLGAASGIYLLLVSPSVPDDVFSYPLGSDAFAAIQVWFFVQHLGLVAGIAGLLASGAAGPSRWARGGLVAAMAGMLMLGATELWAITKADATYPSAETDPLDALYGVDSILCGLGLVVAGVAVARAGRWTGWRRWVPLATGVWVFVPMTPMIIAGFVPARLGIVGWMVLFAVLGWLLTRPGEADRH